MSGVVVANSTPSILILAETVRKTKMVPFLKELLLIRFQAS
jgi:hypothetical protein